jgi:hypothetical protein
MTQLPLPGPDKGFCEGERDRCTGDTCPVFGRLLPFSRDGRRRVQGCDDPSARGRRNRRKGQRKQSAAARAIGIPRTNLKPGHEEHFQGAVRVEIKAGAQVKPIDTRFRAYKAQSDVAKAFGDTRPFAAIVMPEGTSDGIVLVRLSEIREFAAAIMEMMSLE